MDKYAAADSAAFCLLPPQPLLLATRLQIQLQCCWHLLLLLLLLGLVAQIHLLQLLFAPHLVPPLLLLLLFLLVLLLPSYLHQPAS
jgi:hypothetical protein